jgi:hypothetical protein
MITHYWQQAPPWRAVRLGTSNQTIGNYGCAVCALASYLADAGAWMSNGPTEPGTLNRWLARNGGFYRGNLLIFDSVRDLGVEVVEYIDCRQYPAPMDIIGNAVMQELGVLVQVDFRPGGGQNSHFVRLLEVEADDCLIMDPWMADGYGITWMMPRYALPSWNDPARAIMRAIIYAPIKRRTPAFVATNDALRAQEELGVAPWAS